VSSNILGPTHCPPRVVAKTVSKVSFWRYVFKPRVADRPPRKLSVACIGWGHAWHLRGVELRHLHWQVMYHAWPQDLRWGLPDTKTSSVSPTCGCDLYYTRDANLNFCCTRHVWSTLLISTMRGWPATAEAERGLAHRGTGARPTLANWVVWRTVFTWGARLEAHLRAARAASAAPATWMWSKPEHVTYHVWSHERFKGHTWAQAHAHTERTSHAWH